MGEEARAGGGEGIGEEEAGGGAEELGDSAGALRAEYGEAGGAFSEIENQRCEAGNRAEEHSHEYYGEGLKGERDGGEEQAAARCARRWLRGRWRRRRGRFLRAERVLHGIRAMQKRERLGERGWHIAIPFELITP